VARALAGPGEAPPAWLLPSLLPLLLSQCATTTTLVLMGLRAAGGFSSAPTLVDRSLGRAMMPGYRDAMKQQRAVCAADVS
jgi:hypothetical protein